MGPGLLDLAQQGLSSLADGYDLLAPDFDHTPFRTPSSVLEGMAAFFAQDTQAGRYRAVLDLGCGTGAVSQTVAPFVSEHLCGIDQSSGMLAGFMRAMRPWQDRGLQLEYLQGDILDYQAQERFDLVASFGVLGHIELSQHSRLFEVIFRVLRPGGKFVTALAHYGAAQRWKQSPSWRTACLLAFSRCFDTAMRVRNQLIAPPFPMYYRNLDLQPACERLRVAGFELQIQPDRFPFPFEQLQLVVARKACRASRG